MILALLFAQLLPIYGHRGMVQEAPEDTLPAYRLCLEAGIGIEVDVRLTRDGVPIVIHDVTVDRTTNGKGRVDALTFAEIRRLDAGSWFSPKFRDARVPTLEEVLQLVREVDRAGVTRIVIDQKELAPGVEHQVLELLRRYDLVQRSFVLCKEVGMLARFKQAEPAIKTSAIVDRRDEIEPLLSRPDVGIVWLSKRVTGALAADEVKRINAKGKRVVHFIAEREADRWRAAVAGGVDGIITDFAREAKAVLHPVPAKPPWGFQSRTLADASGDKHPFVVFVPAGYRPGSRLPVMLFLHGSGERGANNIDPLMAGIGPAIWKRKSKFPFVVVFPQCRFGANWLADGPDAKRALGMLRQVQQEFETDPERVILTGLSMGGSGTWTIAAQNPSAWSAIVPMCSRPDASTAERFAAARLPIWNFCGDKDRPETVQANRDMHAALLRSGANAKYTEYPGIGHNCWDSAYGTEELYAWLLEQRKTPDRGK